MNTWLKRYDETFLSIIKDETKRKDYLNQLYRWRVVCVFLLLSQLIMAILGVIWDSTWVVVASLVMLGLFGINYLDTDFRIIQIRLYELLSK